MKNVLLINSSITGDNSVSRQLASELVEHLAAQSSIALVERDFAQQEIPHLDGARLGALFTDEAERSPQQVAAVAFADTLVAELLAADTLIITLPMYNFSIPSMLKAWVDHIARAGVTFQYTDTGPVGLLEGKKVYLVSALGGKHAAGGTDFMRPYMQLLMNFIGISDVHFVSAEGLSMGEEARSAGLSEARAQITSL
jgi:FMN-dependent NADH-azoreductase